MDQWLGHHPFTAVGGGSLPDCGTKIMHATCGAAKKTERKKKNLGMGLLL